MAVTIVMPKLGMAMSEGVVAEWVRPDGAEVAKDDVVAVVESEKITYEVRAPESGVLRHAATVQETLAVGRPIGYVAAVGETITTSPTGNGSAPHAEASGTVAVGAGVAARTEVVTATERPVLATPVAKRLAREHDVPLSEVTGTGPGGRIQEQDVLDYLARRAPGQEAAAQGPAVLRTIPFSGVRATIARNMTESLQTMAQVTITTEADVTALVELYERVKRTADISLTSAIVTTVASALRAHPGLNATLAGTGIQLLAEINIGVGVALERGLIVPVIREADRRSLVEIDRELKRLAEAARSGTLTPDEVAGGTFTITNLGMFGVDAFTPIINPPQVAILGIGRVVEKPAVYQGDIVKRSLMVLSLTFDHRIVDGAPAAAFLQTLREDLEQPTMAEAAEAPRAAP